MPFLEEKCTCMTRPLAASPACKEGGFTSCCGGNVRGSCAVEGDPSGSDAPVIAAVGLEGGGLPWGILLVTSLVWRCKGKQCREPSETLFFETDHPSSQHK